MNCTSDTTLADIVRDDFRAAAVLSRYRLDFCCKGGRTLSDACSPKGIDPQEVLDLIAAERSRSTDMVDNFTGWSPDLLSRYIEERHHAYIRTTGPVIAQHLSKVARVHGERHPETVRVAHLFDKLQADLLDHLAKEEQILFPYIRRMTDTTAPSAAPFSSVAMPVRNMMTEHDMAGDDMEEIRRLTGDYTPPADACTTYRIAYRELEEFERDLHTHVHLENNILFPGALEVEKKQVLRQSGAQSSL